MERNRVMRGDRLKDARTKAGLTQEDLGQRIGATKAQINRYEGGKTDPSADLLVRLAEELMVSVDWLLGLVSNPGGHIQPPELTPHELRLLAAFRKHDVEGAMRAMLEGRRPEPE